jgi:hypothetical protein
MKLADAIGSCRKLAPRFQRYSGSPNRFMMICTPAGVKKKKKRCVTPIVKKEEDKSQEKISFSPKTTSHIFISDPSSPYDLKSRRITMVQKEFAEKLNESEEKNKSFMKGIEKYSNGCKELEKQINRLSSKNQEQIQNLSMRKEPLHKFNTEFFKAVKNNDDFEVHRLLSLHPELANEVDGLFQTALHWAARRNQMKIARILIGSGANPRLKDKLGRTPESVARKYGNIDLCKVIIGAERRSAVNLNIARNNSLETIIQRPRSLKKTFLRNP